MSEAINAALAILAASLILWAVEPARAEVQDGGKKTTTMERVEEQRSGIGPLLLARAPPVPGAHERGREAVLE